MMIPKIFTPEEETRLLLLQGTSIVYEAVKSTYSPKSGNIGIELNWGNPVTSHDGVTVARAIADKDGRKNTGIRLIVEASEMTNRNAGDGTSATVILTHKEFQRAVKYIAAGYNAMELRRGMDRAAVDILRLIDEVKVSDVTNADLRNIATVSAGSAAIGALIANTIIKVGNGSGVTIEGSATPDITSEIVKGFHWGKGVDSPYLFNDFDLRRAAYDNVWVMTTDKPLKEVSDVKPIIQWLAKQDDKNMIIVGVVSGYALETIVANKVNGIVNIVTVSPPPLGNMNAEFLSDVAAVTGGKVVPRVFDFDNQDPTDVFGFAQRVVVNETTTTIIDGAGDKKAIKARLTTIKKQLEDNTDSQVAERLEGRIAKLTGKIGVIRVGAPTESDRNEKILRVEDAVMATRAAREDGFVAGGATTLLRIGADILAALPSPTTDEQVGYRMVFEAIQDPFKILLNNTGIEDIGYHKHAVLKAEEGFGYNVRELTEEPINLLEAGIIDPAKVVKEAVKNSVANAGLLVTMNGLITMDIDEIRKNQQVED